MAPPKQHEKFAKIFQNNIKGKVLLISREKEFLRGIRYFRLVLKFSEMILELTKRPLFWRLFQCSMSNKCDEVGLRANSRFQALISKSMWDYLS